VDGIECPNRFDGEWTTSTFENGRRNTHYIAPRCKGLQRLNGTALLHCGKPSTYSSANHATIRFGKREGRSNLTTGSPKEFLSFLVLLKQRGE
jgi:hypothetical protein